METLPPYYAVIFTSTLKEKREGYAQMAKEMERLARQQPGFLDFESAKDTLGISISYWKSKEAIAAWKSNMDHQMAQRKGKETWYSWYTVRICKVERSYTFNHRESVTNSIE